MRISYINIQMYIIIAHEVRENLRYTAKHILCNIRISRDLRTPTRSPAFRPTMSCLRAERSKNETQFSRKTIEDDIMVIKITNFCFFHINN